MKTSATLTIACFLVATSAASAFAQAQRGGTSVKSQTDNDRIVCRRFLRIGSLADSYRTCKTNREWQREHDNLQQLSVSNSCRDATNCNP